MRFTLILALILSLGCSTFAGTIDPGKEATAQECSGVYVSLGNTTGPCGLKGGGISLPGAELVGRVFEAVAGSVMAFLGRAPIVIEHQAAPPN